MKPSTLFWCATAMAACASVSPPSPTETTKLSEARQLLSDDPDGALRITDDLLGSNPNLVEARLLAAQGSRMLAMQPGRGRADLLLQDAVTNLERVVQASPAAPETWRLLADCRFDLGQFEGATTAALEAAEGFSVTSPTAPMTEAARKNAASAMLLAADSELRTFVTARQAEIKNGEENRRGFVEPSTTLAKQAIVIAERYESVRPDFPAKATTQTAVLYQWLGQDQAAAEELERGIGNHPEEGAIHEAYLTWMTNWGQHEAMSGAYSRFVRANPDAVILRWYQGRALYTRADDLRRQGNFQGAMATYGKSKDSFGEYAALVPSHAQNANQWLALCELSIARSAVELGDLNGARDHLFAADTITPLAVEYTDGLPRIVDTFGSHYTGVVFAIHRALTESSESALQRTLDFNEAVFQRHPDRWGFVYNNAALAARDLGVQKDTAGEPKAAMELWERSYAYYEKATALSPDDARIVNDTGLMLIYHLDRDLDRARECFDRAIEVGQAQLDAMPEDTDPRDRELLEEAVGDAWQNIAVLMSKHLGKPFAEYERFCKEAVRFFPYGRREAAAMLREHAGTAGAGTPATLAGNAGAPNDQNGQAQGGATEAFKKIEKAARAKADAGDFDGALVILDSVLKDCKDHAPYQVMRGECNYGLAIASRDAGRRGTEFFFADAITSLTRAVELDSDPVGPRLLLAQAQYATSDFTGAAKTTSAALLHMQSLGGGKAEDQVKAHTVRARAAAQAYAKGKADEQDNPELLTDARGSLRFLEQKDLLDASLMELWSNTEQWAAAPAAAVQIYVRALEKNPDDQAILGKLVDTASAQNQLQLANDALAARKDATALWYLGKVRFLMANAQRERQKVDEAMQTLDQSVKSFESSMAQNASYRASCERWIAMCLGKKGNIAYTRDNVAEAEKLLLDAAKMSPEGLVDDLGNGESTKRGIMLVADKHLQKGELGKVEAIYRTVSDAATGDLDMLNNSGLFARDYGNRLENDGKTKEAMEMYEQSYKAYGRALQLDPTNIRLRNDRALIAIYHLERDWDEVKQLLDGAVTDGKKILAENPPTETDAFEQLDEAVGDCYENLALWHIKHSKDGSAAKAAALESQKHHPGQRRGGARRHLNAAERLLQDK